MIWEGLYSFKICKTLFSKLMVFLNRQIIKLIQFSQTYYRHQIIGMQTNSGTTKLKKTDSFIGDYHQAPNYMKDNQHITHGYRINFDSPKKILRSLFMLHNESVNIWSHFIPAIVLIFFIIYLLVFVGPTNIMHDFETGRQKLSQEIKSYSEALNNFTFIMKMKEIKSETDREMEQISQSIMNSYSNFEVGLQAWKANVESKFQNFQNEVKSSFSSQVTQLQSLKQDFQRLFVPYVVNGIKDQIDPEILNSMTERLQKIKQDLDSDKFSYIQMPMKSGPNPHLVSRWPIFVMLIAAAICLSCSATFHLFYPMSGKAYQLFSRLDYAGVNILIIGSSFPPFYYGMYCNFLLAVFYLTIISLLGSSLFVVSLFQYLHRPENFTLKSLCYGGFGVSLVIPLSHQLINEFVFNNYGDTFSMSSIVVYFLACGFFYLFGLYVYTARCPERHHPGRFNVCGNSHQIWHGFVVLGVLATYFGSLQAFEVRKQNVCPIFN